MATRKKKTTFEDPILQQFYQATLGNASTTVGPAHTYNWTTANLDTASRRASGQRKRAAKKKATSVSAQHNRYASVNDLAGTVDKERAKNKRYGGTNEDTHKRNGVLSRVLDIISRPNYAVAEAVNRGFQERAWGGKDFKGGGIGDTFKAIGEGLVGGFTGKNKTYFAKVEQNVADALHAAHRGASPKDIKKGEGYINPLVKFTTGIAADIALDPSTYLGFGMASRVGRVGAKSHASARMKQVLKDIGVADEDAAAILSHAKFTAGTQTKAAAKAAQKTVDEAAEYAAKVEGDKVYRQLIADGADATTARSKSQIAKGNMQVQLRKMADDILDTPGYRNIAIKGGFGKGLLGQKGLEIPLSRYAVSAAAAPFKGLGQWDPAARAASKFTELFSNSAKIFPELQQLRLEHRSSGLARVHARGEFLTKTFKPFSKADRHSILEDALAGNTNTGKFIKDYNGAEHDAAAFVLSRLRVTQARFASDMIHHDLILEPEDVNRFSKYAGLTFKKNGPDDQNWIINSLKDSNIKDAGEALFVVESAMEQALSRRTMLKSFADTWGARSGTMADVAKQYGFAPKDLPTELRPYKNAKYLQARGWRTVNGKTGKPIKELKGMLFDPDTAKGMERILGLLDDEREIQGMLRGINNLTGKWKFFVTVPNPGFHIRNSIGDMYINLMDDVSNKAYFKSGSLIKNKKMFEVPGAGQISPIMQAPHEHMMTAAQQFRPLEGKYNKQFVKFKKPLKDTQGKPVESLSSAEVWAAYNRYGMRQNYTISEYGRAFDEKRLAGSALSKIKDPLVKFSEDREDYFRLAHFIHLIEANPSKATDLDKVFSYAAQRVRETHFDYTDFTKFEKQGMSNLIPFYKWTRKSLPLQTELLFTQPGKVAVIPKIMRDMSDAMGYDWEGYNYLNTERVIPNWLRNANYLPGNFSGLPGLSGPQQYFNVSSPFGDAANQFGTPIVAGDVGGLSNTLAGMLNPVIKDAAELKFNERAYTGEEIFKKGDDKGRLRELLDYLSEQTPITRIAGKAANKEDTTPSSFYSWLLGLSIQPNTEGRQLSELYRQRDNTRGRYKGTRAKYIKKHHLRPETRLP